jgi:hypothetical protein
VQARIQEHAEIVGVMKTVHGQSEAAAADAFAAASYPELIKLAQSDPPAFRKYLAEHREDFEAKKAQAAQG